MSHPIVKLVTFPEAAVLLRVKHHQTVHNHAALGTYGTIERNRNHRLVRISELERLTGREFPDREIEAVLSVHPARIAMLREIGFPVETLPQYRKPGPTRVAPRSASPPSRQHHFTDPFSELAHIIASVRRCYVGKSDDEIVRILANGTAPIANPRVSRAHKSGGSQ